MPRDANGNFSLVSGYLAVQGQTVQPSNHNPPLEDIASGLTASLPRDGSAAMTAPVKLPDGTSAAPAMTFASEPTLGIYRKSAGVVAVAGGQLIGGRFIGELIHYTGLTAMPLTVLPFGQTLSRATYAELWTFAQAQITAGNLFYNTGDGSTTFGIGDCRAFVFAGKDDMGGTAAGRLTLAVSGVDGTKLGWASGSQSTVLVTANLPPYTPSGTITNGAITSTPSQSPVVTGVGGLAFGSGSGGGLNSLTVSSTQAPSTFTGTAQGGTSTAINNVQPTMVVDVLLYAGA